MTEIERISYQTRLFHCEMIAKDPYAIVTWLNAKQTMILNKEDFVSSPVKVLDAFDVVKESLKPPENCRSAFDKTLSKMVVSSIFN